VVTAAAVAVTGLAACSSAPQPNHPSQASVTVNGNTVARNQRVTCSQQLDNLPGTKLQSYWMINIGDQDVSGVNASINDSGERLTANSVRILNLGGFTGMYSQDDGGNADVKFASETFTITGTANGFNTYKPDEPATATFKIVATC
jgi:hypothetical protein